MPEEFTSSLFIQKKLTEHNSEKAYRVYTSAEDYTVIKAATALEALRSSGIQNPHRIIKHTEIGKLVRDEKLEVSDILAARQIENQKLRLNLGTDISGLLETESGDLPDII